MSILTIPDLDEDKLLASICRDSYYHFLREFWDVVVAETPQWNWHIEYLCDKLQWIAERVIAGRRKKFDLISNMPPGTTKSIIHSIAYNAWVWTKFPPARFVCGSHGYNLAMFFSSKTRDIVKSDKYRRLFPKVQIRSDIDSKGYFANTKGGDRFSFGVNGSVTGMHGHFIIIDDPIDPQQAVSELELKRANDWMSETLPSRKVDKAVTPMILVMQRLHVNDPTASRLEKREISPVFHVCLPAELTEDVQPPKLAGNYRDGYLDPDRLPPETLKEQLGELGEYAYNAQYLQHPIMREGAFFHVDRFNFGVAPLKFKRLVRFWDKAGTFRGGAYTVGLKMGLDFEGRFWVLDVVREQLDSARRERLIKQTAQMDGKEVTIGVEQEPGSGGKESAEATVRNLAGYYVKVYKVGPSDGDKQNRADPFSSQVNGGNVWLIQAQWNKPYIDELRYWPMSRYKDQGDASGGAFNMLAKEKIVVGGLRIGRR